MFEKAWAEIDFYECILDEITQGIQKCFFLSTVAPFRVVTSSSVQTFIPFEVAFRKIPKMHQFRHVLISVAIDNSPA